MSWIGGGVRECWRKLRGSNDVHTVLMYAIPKKKFKLKTIKPNFETWVKGNHCLNNFDSFLRTKTFCEFELELIIVTQKVWSSNLLKPKSGAKGYTVRKDKSRWARKDFNKRRKTQNLQESWERCKRDSFFSLCHYNDITVHCLCKNLNQIKQ